MRRARRFWILLATVGIVVALALGSSAMRPRCVAVDGEEAVSVPLARLARGAVSFFCYRDSAGARLRFILARDEDGKVHSVFDACRQCYSYQKGYTASRGDLVCRLCGNRYEIKSMEKGHASCVPINLPNRQHGDVVEVKVSDLKRGKALF